MPSRKIEGQLEALSALRSSPLTEESSAQLRKALNDRVNLVVAKAAATAAHLNAQALRPELVAAFGRLLPKGAEADPQCWAKNAIAKALKELGHDDCSCFLPGLKHVQMEPVWGSMADTAGTLRSICVLALLQCVDLTRVDKLWRQMEALTDREPVVRLEAARALEEMEGREAAFLLRMKARLGDKEAGVTGQALASLLTLQRDDAVAFVAEFLDATDEDVRAEAALALGASRSPEALHALIGSWQAKKGLGGEAILRGISASRLDSGIEFLTKIVREAREREALAALSSLALHRDSADIRSCVAEAIASRNEEVLGREFRQLFREG